MITSLSMRAPLWLLLLAAFGAGLDASPLYVHLEGVWGPSPIASPATSPNQPWSLDFFVESLPAAPDVNPGTGFSLYNPDVFDFQYTLNGVPATIGTFLSARFYNDGRVGVIGDIFSFDLYTSFGAWYAGSEAFPEMLTGTGVFDPSFALFHYFPDAVFTESGLTGLMSITATPEPSSAVLLLLGATLLFGAWHLRYR